MQYIIKFILFISFCSGFNCFSQQTVFNVPSADILSKGEVYLELDASFKTNNEASVKRFSSFVPRIVFGVGKNVEAGLNVIGNIQPGVDSTTLVSTVKWRFYQNEKKKLSLIAGNNFYIPLRNKKYKFGTYSYAAAAKTLGKTRITAGGYVYSKNVVEPSASRGGGQFAIEQTLNSKLAFAADWITGKHANGYFTPGLIYKPRKNVTAYLNYSIGNYAVKHGNHFFLFEIGYNFD
jgi:hypothetical protein